MAKIGNFESCASAISPHTDLTAVIIYQIKIGVQVWGSIVLLFVLLLGSESHVKYPSQINLCLFASLHENKPMSSIAAEKLPDARGHFGPYGGRFVPETLMHPLKELEEEYFRAQHDPEFQRELSYYLTEFVGRPTPLYFAERLTRDLGGAKIYLKREDLNHTGAHKINNAMGQILLAKRMGKTRIIAETGAGQHGVATATVSAMFGLKCVIYMGEVDCQRQA